VGLVSRVVSQAGAACGLVLALAACGSSPTNPDPIDPPPANQPPVIESIALSAPRAEVEEEVRVTATVRDAETPVEQLIFEWAADTGTFAGQGASVTWRAPADAATPADVVLRLLVREPYGTAPAGGQRPEHRVNANSSAIRLHNSPRELAELALRFLSDFANSSVPADACVREFSDSCRGKLDERLQIEDNRRMYQILSSSLRLRSVSVDENRMAGGMRVDCGFTSRIKECDPSIPNCSVGAIESVVGDCVLTAVYEQSRWWLCDSNFLGTQVPSMRLFFGAPR
jgi:hypothetical protein